MCINKLIIWRTTTCLLNCFWLDSHFIREGLNIEHENDTKNKKNFQDAVVSSERYRSSISRPYAIQNLISAFVKE